MQNSNCDTKKYKGRKGRGKYEGENCKEYIENEEIDGLDTRNRNMDGTYNIPPLMTFTDVDMKEIFETKRNQVRREQWLAKKQAKTKDTVVEEDSSLNQDTPILETNKNQDSGNSTAKKA